MISTYNEWDPLRTSVVGRADTANWPVNDPVFKNEGEKTTWKETPVPTWCCATVDHRRSQ
jgi:hypothetical protein